MKRGPPKIEPFRVIVKCKDGKSEAVVKLKAGEFELQRPKTTLTKKFKFSKIFGPKDSTAEMHSKAISNDIQSAISAGESITVLTFGARGTGKTTTMRSADGLVMKVAQDVFNGLPQGGDSLVSVSCLLSAVTPPAQSNLTGRQVTHEVLLDGLLPQGETGEVYRGGLTVREHPRRGFYCEGLQEIEVKDVAECWEYLQLGICNCQLEEARCRTAVEGAPLRVHCLFTIRVRHRAAHGEETISEVQMVDLAGWIRDKPAPKGRPDAKQESNVVGEDMVVKAFQRIIGQLEQKASHVPYRDSKLTRIMKPCLGSSATCIPIIHVSLDNYEETEAMLALATKMLTLKNTISSSGINYGQEIASLRNRARDLARELGRPPDIKSSDLEIGAVASDELLQLRELLVSAEQLEKDSLAWKDIQFDSKAFKKDAGKAAAENRVDRQPKKEPKIREISDEEIQKMAKSSGQNSSSRTSSDPHSESRRKDHSRSHRSPERKRDHHSPETKRENHQSPRRRDPNMVEQDRSSDRKKGEQQDSRRREQREHERGVKFEESSPRRPREAKDSGSRRLQADGNGVRSQGMEANQAEPQPAGIQDIDAISAKLAQLQEAKAEKDIDSISAKLAALKMQKGSASRLRTMS